MEYAFDPAMSEDVWVAIGVFVRASPGARPENGAAPCVRSGLTRERGTSRVASHRGGAYGQ